MRKFDLSSFDIQVGLLVLSHAIDLLLWIKALEPGREMIVTTNDWFELARFNLESATFWICKLSPVPSKLLEQDFSTVITDSHFTPLRYCSANTAVHQGSAFICDVDI